MALSVLLIIMECFLEKVDFELGVEKWFGFFVLFVSVLFFFYRINVTESLGSER